MAAVDAFSDLRICAQQQLHSCMTAAIINKSWSIFLQESPSDPVSELIRASSKRKFDVVAGIPSSVGAAVTLVDGKADVKKVLIGLVHQYDYTHLYD